MIDTLVYLLDTNVLSEMMRSTPSAQVSDFLDRTRDEGHGISAVTVWEIEYGICRLDDGKRCRNLKCMFDSVLAELFKDRIFPWEDQDAALCAEIMEDRRRAGRALDDHFPDAIIASTARVRNLVLVTRNISEFEDTGLRLVDPWMT